MMGSGVFAGVFPLQTALEATDAEGKRVGDELRAIGYAGAAEVAAGRSAPISKRISSRGPSWRSKAT